MSRYITVEVTDKDIRNGDRYLTASCPLARAIRRAGFPNARVTDRHLQPFDTDGPAYDLTDKAKDFIARFDDGQSVRPTKFRLEVGA